MDLTVVFLVVSIVCFVVAALGVTAGRVSLVPAGLAFLAASFLPL